MDPGEGTSTESSEEIKLATLRTWTPVSGITRKSTCPADSHSPGLCPQSHSSGGWHGDHRNGPALGWEVAGGMMFSVVKSSSGGPELGSEHPHSSSQLPATPASGNLMFSCGVCGHCIHTVHIYARRQNTRINKIKLR